MPSSVDVHMSSFVEPVAEGCAEIKDLQGSTYAGLSSRPNVKYGPDKEKGREGDMMRLKNVILALRWKKGPWTKEIE